MKLCPLCETGFPDNAATCPTHGGMLSEIRDLRPGMLVRNTYRIVRKLGQGGMGAVYLAQHTLMDEPQALKFLSSELSQDEAFTSRFLREVRTLRQVRHKNVVDAGNLEPAEDGTLFFPMEFVDGPDLRSFLESAPRPFDVALALSITRGIAEGLGAAHAKGMVHRDIKPENIMMARDGDGWVPKIADFGIVATRELSKYTQTGSLLLTPFYAAPEQWLGTRAAELDGRTDLYALGGVLYEMLTGQKVFDAENYHGWAQQHLNAVPQPPSSLRPDLANWKGLDELVLRLLSKDREQRPADVAESIRLLDSIRYVSPAVQRVTPTKIETPPLPQGPSPNPELSASSITRLSPEIPPDSQEKQPKKRTRFVPEAIVIAVVVIVFFFSWEEAKNRESQLSTDLPAQTAPADQTQPQETKPDLAQVEQQAFALYKQKHYKEAAPLLDQACTGGNAGACNDLGLMYGYTLGVAQDTKRSATLFSKACDDGIPEGCYNLGTIYSGGTLGAMDGPRALSLFTKACDGGSDEGCNRLGISYLQRGDGVLDVPKAIAIFSKACDTGLETSCLQLGSLYESGRGGVEQDYTHAVLLFSKACDAGNAGGCARMGDSYWSGHGIEKDNAKSDEYFKKACSMGDAYACGVLKDSK